jgi:hypothetical protein
MTLVSFYGYTHRARTSHLTFTVKYVTFHYFDNIVGWRKM